jgi:hypothetical protein
VLAAADGQAVQNALVANVQPGVYNGTNYDRQRSATAASATTGTGLLGAGILGHDGTNYRRLSTDTSGQANANIVNTPAVTQSGTWTVQPGNTQNTTPWLVKNVGKSVSSQTALTTTATVSGAAGNYLGGSFINLNSAPAYIQVFDTTGAVTLGTTVPSWVQPIPANATPANGAAFVFDVVGGITVANGIKIAATTTATGASTVATALIGYITYL